MGDLIESFQQVDKRLVAAIDSKKEAVMMLKNIEAGSLRAWLANMLKAVDDDALKTLDWKPAVGKYLAKGKYILIDFIQKRTTVSNREEIAELEQKLLAAAKETNIRQIPTYRPIPTGEIVASLIDIRDAISPLNQTDKAKYISDDNEADFNLIFYVTPEPVEDLLTRETIASDQMMIIKLEDLIIWANPCGTSGTKPKLFPPKSPILNGCADFKTGEWKFVREMH
jgi:hypothetical protein